MFPPVQLFWKSAERKEVRIPVHASVMPALHVDKDSRDSGMVRQRGNGAGEGLIKRTASEEAFSMYAATEGAIEDVEEERMLVRNFITESNRRVRNPPPQPPQALKIQNSILRRETAQHGVHSKARDH